ncbi:related to Magnesium transporter ALR1 [Saccharomycodes ludwigii]|uniref:Related to Magnesium transporter ALR1 n=1 Tax=Saccharomycodes ludwigii TaxID=36035 RepID=A0A376B9X6_9ASCO|nr:hypothetical protein SCDLUD_005019 [Saccharomycodes ludwigii]KAH3898696.1 hypothetical protein SCDLUD_005019 [Saccharomycodes ludwigii]SSD61457.1 related to Magnesium transporter ALR1 [Saccharomycodes ludwigii]
MANSSVSSISILTDISSTDSDDAVLSSNESLNSLKTEEHNELYDHREQNYSVLPSDENHHNNLDDTNAIENNGANNNKPTIQSTASTRVPSFKLNKPSLEKKNSSTGRNVTSSATNNPTSNNNLANNNNSTTSITAGVNTNNGSNLNVSKKKSRSNSHESSILLFPILNQLTKTNTNASVLTGISNKKKGNNNLNRRNSMETSDSRDSQETEEDVCFPMIQYQHERINGIDFDELEEFAQEEIRFNNLQQAKINNNPVMYSPVSKPQEHVLETIKTNSSSTSVSSSVSKAALRYTPRDALNYQQQYFPPTSASAVIVEDKDNAKHSKFSKRFNMNKSGSTVANNNNTGLDKNGVSFGLNKVEQEYDDDDEEHNLGSNKTYTKASISLENPGNHLSSLHNDSKLSSAAPGTASSPLTSDGIPTSLSPNQPIVNNDNFLHYTVPDRFSFFSSDMEETVHSPSISSLLTNSNATSFRKLFNDGEPTWWLDCICPTDEEMKCISKCFGIHPLTAEDIRMQESREKVELFKSYYFVCFNTFESDNESEDFLEPINVYIVVFRSGVLTFHFGPEISHCSNVRRRVRQLRDYVDVNSDWICYALIDDITDGFAPVIQNIEYEADMIEDSVFIARDLNFAEMLQRIGESRRKTMTLMRLLSGKADVIKMFAKRCQDESKGIGPALTSQINIANLSEKQQSNQQCSSSPRSDIALYLGDIQDHVLTMYQNLLSYEKIFSRSHSNYLAQLQVESFNSNNKVTEILGKVTVLGTMLVPLNLITGLFGMNVRVPGDDQRTFGWFFGILGVIILVVLSAVFISNYWLNHMEAPQTLNEAAISGARSVISKSMLSGIFNKKDKKPLSANSNRNANSIGLSQLGKSTINTNTGLGLKYARQNKCKSSKSINSLPSKLTRYD